MEIEGGDWLKGTYREASRAISREVYAEIAGNSLESAVEAEVEVLVDDGLVDVDGPAAKDLVDHRARNLSHRLTLSLARSRRPLAK